MSNTRSPLTVSLSAPDTDALTDMIVAIAGALADPDMIVAVRLDEIACMAELDLASCPVGPRQLH